MMTIQALREAHEDLLNLQNQILKNEEDFSPETYAKSKAIFREIDIKQAKIAPYNELFAMNLADFVSNFCEACHSAGITAELIAKPKVVTCTEAKNYTGSALMNYTIPFEYNLRIFNGENRITAQTVRLLTSRFSLITNYATEKAEDSITQIQETALDPDRLKNIKINLLTNKDLHVQNFRNTAKNCEVAGVDLDNLLWGTLNNYANKKILQRAEEITAKFVALDSEREALIVSRSVDTLLKDYNAETTAQTTNSTQMQR